MKTLALYELLHTFPQFTSHPPYSPLSFFSSLFTCTSFMLYFKYLIAINLKHQKQRDRLKYIYERRYT